MHERQRSSTYSRRLQPRPPSGAHHHTHQTSICASVTFSVWACVFCARACERTARPPAGAGSQSPGTGVPRGVLTRARVLQLNTALDTFWWVLSNRVDVWALTRGRAGGTDNVVHSHAAVSSHYYSACTRMCWASCSKRGSTPTLHFTKDWHGLVRAHRSTHVGSPLARARSTCTCTPSAS